MERYDREIIQHKYELGKALDTDYPGWRDPGVLKRIGEASRIMIGKPFLKEGSVSREFMEELIERAEGTWEHTKAVKVFGELG